MAGPVDYVVAGLAGDLRKAENWEVLLGGLRGAAWLSFASGLHKNRVHDAVVQAQVQAGTHFDNTELAAGVLAART